MKPTAYRLPILRHQLSQSAGEEVADWPMCVVAYSAHICQVIILGCDMFDCPHYRFFDFGLGDR